MHRALFVNKMASSSNEDEYSLEEILQSHSKTLDDCEDLLRQNHESEEQHDMLLKLEHWIRFLAQAQSWISDTNVKIAVEQVRSNYNLLRSYFSGTLIQYNDCNDNADLLLF